MAREKRRDQSSRSARPLPRRLQEIADKIGRDFSDANITLHDTHAVVCLEDRSLPGCPSGWPGGARDRDRRQWPPHGDLQGGRPPREVSERFELASMRGTHAIGHTRMATESAVTTDGAHPYSTGKDQCLVHNGSLSNHNNVRRVLTREGSAFETENDTEVAAGYLSWRCARACARRGARVQPRRPRRFLHFRGRYRERLRRAARRDGLQAGGDGGDGSLRSLRF